MKEEKRQIKRNEITVFLILYCLIGVLYFVSVPLFRIPDEREHFERAYEISMGYLISDHEEHGLGGRNLPANIDLGIDYKVADLPLTVQLLRNGEKLSEQSEFKIFANTALYSPLTYLPQATGIWIVRLFTKKVFFLIYAARLFNWIFAFVLASYAVIRTPICKKIMMAVLLLPMSMQEMVSCAPDGVGIALICALLAFIFHLCYEQKEKLTLAQKAGMVFLSVYICQYKIVYLPFCFLLFLIPYERFGSKKQYWIWAASLGSMVAILSLLWLHISSPYQQAFTIYTFGTTGKEQVLYVLSHPGTYFSVIGNTLKIQVKAYYDQAVGMSLGYYNVFPDPRAILFLEGMLPVLAILEKEEFTIKAKERLTVLAVSIMTILLIFTSLYVQFNVPGAKEINGVQGRYFLPLFPILLFVLKIPLPIKYRRKWGFYGLYAIEGLLLLMVVRTAFMTFWGR